MNANPVVRNYAYCLAHVPDLVQFGSKPRREIGNNAVVRDALQASLRPFADAVGYVPNQAFIGNLTPEELAEIPRPWFEAIDTEASEVGKFGEIIPQLTLYAVLKQADVLEPPLFEITDRSVDSLSKALAERSLLGARPLGPRALRLRNRFASANRPSTHLIVWSCALSAPLPLPGR